jgi:hypothetical protein
MNLSKLLPILLAGFVLVVAGAHAAPPVVAIHVADQKKTSVTIRFTETVKIVLPTPSPAQPGYEWQIISNDSRILRLTSSPKPSDSIEKILSADADNSAAAKDKAPADKAPATARAASGAAWATSFVALRPGRSIVRLVYIKGSDSGEEIPTDSREIAVTVSNERPSK